MYDRFPLRLEDDGTVLYPANTEFTEILNRGNKIGYIKSYRTNNLGLRDEVDYPLGTSKRHIVFVGDSFTASQGSSFSWVSKLSRDLEKKGVSIYNLGVFGTGLIHFEKILRHFKNKISFDEIVLVTISDDFMRSYWVPQQEGNRVLFCKKDTMQPCKGIGVVDPSYARELSEKHSVGLELDELEMPLQRHRSKSDGRTMCRWDFGLPVLLKCIAKKSPFLVLIKQELINPLLSPLNSTEFKNSISALKQIRLSFPDKKISLIQLPQRNEVMTKQYKLNLKKHVEAADMEYHTALTACGLSQDDFNDYDGHPTEHGYDKIAACVSKLLQLAL
jgi:hypothetical protein